MVGREDERIRFGLSNKYVAEKNIQVNEDIVKI